LETDSVTLDRYKEVVIFFEDFIIEFPSSAGLIGFDVMKHKK
jgi:hypothetical protein